MRLTGPPVKHLNTNRNLVLTDQQQHPKLSQRGEKKEIELRV